MGTLPVAHLRLGVVALVLASAACKEAGQHAATAPTAGPPDAATAVKGATAAPDAGSSHHAACDPACDRYSAGGKSGRQLADLVALARQAGRFDEAVCLGRPLATDSDAKIAAAANYELSRAWQGLGCPREALAAIHRSLQLRTPGSKVWDLTCAQCQALAAGSCDRCGGSQTSTFRSGLYSGLDGDGSDWYFTCSGTPRGNGASGLDCTVQGVVRLRGRVRGTARGAIVTLQGTPTVMDSDRTAVLGDVDLTCEGTAGHDRLDLECQIPAGQPPDEDWGGSYRMSLRYAAP